MAKQKLYDGFEWIKGYEGIYMINIHGILVSCKRKYSKETMIKKPYLRKSSKNYKFKPSKYFIHILSKNNISIEKSLHRLLAETFIPNPENKPEINHKDGNTLNNNLNNLEWVTKSEQAKHAWENNLNRITQKMKKIMKENGCKRRSLTMDEVKNIRFQYSVGLSKKDISNIYNYKYYTVLKICNNETYIEQ